MNKLTTQEFDNNSRLRKKSKSFEEIGVVGKQSPNNQRHIYKVKFINGSVGEYFIVRLAMSEKAKRPTLTIVLPFLKTSNVK